MSRNALLLAFFLAAGPAVAQQAAQSGQPFVLEAGKIELSELIDRAAAYLGRNILWSAQELQSTAQGGTTITLQHRVETGRDGCEDLLTSLLYRSGFAVSTLDAQQALYEVISLNGPRCREVFNSAQHKSPEEILARPDLHVPVTTAIALQHINATIATNALRPFFASSGTTTGGITIGNVGNNQGLLICGWQHQIATAIRLVLQNDVPPPEPKAPGLAERLAELEQRLAALEEQVRALQGKGK